MREVVENKIKDSNYNLHFIPSKKFKTIHFVAKFKGKLERDTITKRALLPYLLHQGTVTYPSEKELQLKLNQLYGAGLSIDGAKKGNNHIISVRLEIANQKYIQNESSIVDEAISLFNELLFHPYTPNKAFAEQAFKREKETLQEKISSVIDNKMEYANMRLIDEMYEKDPYSLHVHGYEEDLISLEASDLYAYYRQMIEEDQLDIYVLGDFDEQEMMEKIEAKMDHYDKTKSKIEKTRLIEAFTRESPQEVIEQQSIQQAKLHLGYRTNCTFADEDYFALQVFNGIFGGFPSSKLFVNVREENSLAYYAASRLESHKGILLVFSGIAAEDYQQARRIIELQMAAMKNGEFTEVHLEETKGLIVNQLLETLDHPQGIIELLYQQVVSGKQVTPERFIQSIKEVTKEQVIQVANKIQEDTVYLLTSQEGDMNE